MDTKAETNAISGKRLAPYLCIRMSFGKNLRLWRERLGLTLADLEEKSGIATSTLSQIERDLQRPHNSTRRVIAVAMDLKPEDLAHPPPGVESKEITPEEALAGVKRFMLHGDLTMQQVLEVLASIEAEKKRRGID